MPVSAIAPPGRAGSAHITRRAFLGSAAAVTIGTAVYSNVFERHSIDLERVTIRVKNLPEAFAGLRIAQISDIHFAEYTEPALVHEAVRQLNALRPDIVLLTGDFISMGPINSVQAAHYAPIVAEILGGIECPHRWGVLGNHDWMVNADMVVESMASARIPILHNQYLPFERDGARIWIAGIMDALSWESNLNDAVPPTAHTDKEPVVLMAHEPDILPAAARLNAFDLMLSGHTHGGQVRLPFTRPLFLPPLGKRFVAGHFQMGRTQLYVNRGIGTVGMPFRFRCPPELTELTLMPA